MPRTQFLVHLLRFGLVLALLSGSGPQARAQAPAASPAAPTPAESQPPAAGAPQAESGAPFAVFRTASLDPSLGELGAALDPVLLSELEAMNRVQVAARPALDLPAMQLAIDCAGEIAECMQAVTREAGVEGLIAPVLRSAGDEVSVTLLYFATAEGKVRAVTRSYARAGVAQPLLAGVPAMLRELFGVPEPVAAAPSAPADDPAQPAPAEAANKLPPVAALVLGASGVVMLGAGLGLGLASMNNETAYSDARPVTRAQVEAANEDYDRAKRQALVANIAFGVGGAAVVAGAVVWWLGRRSQQPEPKVAWLPVVSPGQLALRVEGRWGR